MGSSWSGGWLEFLLVTITFYFAEGKEVRDKIVLSKCFYTDLYYLKILRKEWIKKKLRKLLKLF